MARTASTAKAAAPAKATKARKGETAPKAAVRATRKAKQAEAAKLPTRAELDIITEVKSDTSGSHIIFQSRAGLVGNYAKTRETPELRAANVVGGSYKAVCALVKALPEKEAALARGVESRQNPHSAKAVRDTKAAKSPKAAKAEAAPKADKKAERKAERAAKAAPKADDARTIKVLDKKFTYGGEGTARRASWDAAAKAKTVAEYLAAGGKAKYLPRFVSAGAIALA